MSKSDPALRETIRQAVQELRAIVSWGLHFTQDSYDQKRYRWVRQISARLAAAVDGRSPEEALSEFERDLFGNGICPLATADAVVLRDNRLLLIKRRDDGLWALPGGFVAVHQTLAEAALRELQEETGLCGRTLRLLGIFDSRFWGSSATAHMHHAVFEVEGGQGEPHSTPEAAEVGFFGEAELPSLSLGHHRRVPFIFKLLRGEIPVPYLDEAGPIPGCDD